jgi:DNA-binding transcriptional ArsR family regulator
MASLCRCRASGRRNLNEARACAIREGCLSGTSALSPHATNPRTRTVKIYSTIWLTFYPADRTFNNMVELNPPDLDAVFHALGDGTRRQMLRHLSQAEHTVGELAAPFAISLAAASKHVKALENAGLIRREVRGRTHLCRLNPGPLASANQWLGYYEAFWSVRLDVLDELLQAERPPIPGPRPLSNTPPTPGDLS